MNKNLSIGDLIHVPAVETVIQLEMADSTDESRAKELVSNFVITDEIQNAFNRIFQSVHRKQGFGAFLKGNYGSGKSHFLAVVFLLLENPQLWELITDSTFDDFAVVREQEILNIKIALHNFSGEESLEAIIFGEIENTVSAKFQQPLLLRNSTLFLEHFNKYIFPQHPEFLKRIDKTGEAWQQNCLEHPGSAAADVYAFVQEYSLPLKPVFDRREALRTLRRRLDESGYQGVFIALDELSEYLKAKPDNVSFNEDLRFLQFMGEACQGGAGEQPIYLIASLQENIEKTGYMEEDLVQRIKDRYPLRFYLAAHHISQLISRRLTSRKPDAREPIQEIYQAFMQAFPKMGITPREFYDIYPIHPHTVTMLEGLTPIFSQHRGVVDFIYHQLTGDEKRSWKGMLHLPANRLVTPDSIFDHFRERIREIPEMNPFVDVVYQTIGREIPELFETQKDREIAGKAIKIMILVEISPLEKRKTVTQLAEMINEPVSDLEQTLNYQYLEEVILHKLSREGSFVSTDLNERGERIYFVSLEITIHQMLRNRIQEILKQAPALEEILPDVMQEIRSDQLPLSAIIAARRKKYVFQWQNTRREGWVIFKLHSIDAMEIEEYLRDLASGERDFGLILFAPTTDPLPNIPPLQKHSRPDSSGFAPALVGWNPRPLTEEETQFLFHYYAHHSLKERLSHATNPQEKQLLQLVQEWLNENRANLTHLAEDLYLEGQLQDIEGWKEFRFAPFYSDFKAILNQIFSPALQQIFPAHSQIMPGDVFVPFAVDKLFMQFIKPGSIHRAEAHHQHIDNLIKLYLEPLRIVKLEDERYLLNLDATQNPLLSELLNCCAGQESVSIYSLYWQLRKGKWGLSREMFLVLMGALLTSGKLMALASGNVTPFHSIQQITDGSIDAVGMGRIIRVEVWKAFQPFLKLEEFKEVLPSYTESTQELFWRRLKSVKENLTSLLNDWEELKRRYENYPAFEPLQQAMSPDIPLLQEFLNGFRSSYPAWRGLEFLAESLGLDRLRHSAEAIFRLCQRTEMLKNHFMELNSIYAYLQHPVLETIAQQKDFQFVTEAKKIYQSLHTAKALERDNLAEIKQKFYEFKTRYLEQYSEAHRAYYEDDVFHLTADVEQHPAVQALQKFRDIENIAPQPDWITVQQKIAGLPRPCDRAPQKHLAISPVCPCGFVPGQSHPAASQTGVVQMAEAGVQSAMKQLQERFRWVLEDYAARLTEIGQESLSSAILQLLNIPTGKLEKQLPQILQLLRGEVAGAINEAIRGKILILYRHFSELEQKVVGRQMMVKELKNVVEEWIRGSDTLNENTYLRVLGSDKDLRLNRQDYQPLTENIVEEGSRFFEAFWLLAWAQQHNRQDWLKQIRDQYRIKELNRQMFSSVLEQRLSAGDHETMQMFLEHTGKLSQLESLLKMEALSQEELSSFVLKERLWKRLSEQASRLLIQKVAPTEPLSDNEANLLAGLARHPRRAEWSHLHLLGSYLKCLHLAQESTQSHPVAFYLTDGWQLPAAISRVKELNQHLDIAASHQIQSLEKKITEMTRQWHFPVQGAFKSRLPMPYFGIDGLPNSLTSTLQKLEGNIILILMDAMRWDIWEAVRPFLQKAVSHQPIFTGAMETASPTTTEVNRQILINQILNARSVINWEIERVSQDVSRQRQVEEKILSGLPLLVLNFTIIDALLHESQDPIHILLDIIQSRLNGLVKPILQKIPPKTHLIITADHGFTGVPGNYSHGGDSFFEKVVPLSVWKGV